MKTIHYTCILAAIVLMSPLFLVGECAECKALKTEIEKCWKHTIDMAKEIRALTKDNAAQGTQLRKHLGY